MVRGTIDNWARGGELRVMTFENSKINGKEMLQLGTSTLVYTIPLSLSFSFSLRKCVIKYFCWSSTATFYAYTYNFLLIKVFICWITKSSWITQYIRSKLIFLLWESHHLKSSRLFLEGRRWWRDQKERWNRSIQLCPLWYRPKPGHHIW